MGRACLCRSRKVSGYSSCDAMKCVHAAGLENVKPGAAVDLPVWLLVELAKRDMIAVK